MRKLTFPAKLNKIYRESHVSTKILVSFVPVSFVLVSCVIAVAATVDSEQQPKITAFHHVGISTNDLERSVAFYRDLLGCEVVSEQGWPGGSAVADQITGLKGSSANYVMLKAGNSHIEIFKYDSPTPKPKDPRHGVNDHGYKHFGIMVDDIDAMYKRLVDAGTFFNSPPIELGGGIKVTYGRDPDGNVFELMGPAGRLPAPGTVRDGN